jgi:predicted RNase H-like HicB family nuclease
MPEQIRVVVLKGERMFFAQCLEVDIAAQGKTSEEAMNNLVHVFKSELAYAGENGRSIMDIGPAPAAYSAIHDSNIVQRTTLAA